MITEAELDKLRKKKEAAGKKADEAANYRGACKPDRLPQYFIDDAEQKWKNAMAAYREAREALDKALDEASEEE